MKGTSWPADSKLPSQLVKRFATIRYCLRVFVCRVNRIDSRFAITKDIKVFISGRICSSDRWVLLL